MKILFVDDDRDLLNQAKMFLEMNNEEFEIETVDLVERALNILDDEEYDIVVSDYQMPKIDGLEFLEILREDMKEEIPFIIFTGKGREEVAMKALNLGANRYIQKGGSAKSQYGVLTDAIKQEYELFKKEKELEISEREKSKILNSTVELVAYQNKDHEILWANKSAGESVGEDPKDLEGRKCYEIWNDRDEVCEDCPIERSFETNTIERGEIKTQDGRRWLITGNPVRSEDGKIEGVVEVSLDITERKEAQELFHKLLNVVPDMISIHDLDMNIVYSNWNGFGDVPEEKRELGSKCYRTYRGYDDICPDCKAKSVIESKESFQDEVTLPDGTWVDLRVIPILDDEGEVELFVEWVRDISKEKKAEKKLKEKERKYRELFESAKVAVIVHGNDGKIISANPEAEKALGLDEEELKEKELDYWEEKLFKENGQSMDIDDFPVSKVYETHELEEEGIVGISKPNTEELRWHTISAVPYLDDEGEIEKVIVSFKDITESKEAKDALKESEERYKALVETAFAGIGITDFNNNLTYVNDRFADMLGYDKDELIGKGLEEISDYQELEKFYEETEKRKEGKTSIYNSKLNKKNGDVVNIKVHASPYKDASGEFAGTVGIVTDVTEREKAEKKLKELHNVASRLENAQSNDEVCKIAVDAAENVLDFSICSIIFIDEGGKRTIKAASRNVSRKDYKETVTKKDTILGKTFYNNESYLIRDLHEHPDAKPARQEYKSAISVPIKDKGVFQAISSDKDAFDERDLEMAELLIDNVSGALERLEMREREEFLHSLLRHDVKNKAVLTDGYFELIEEFELPEEVEEYVKKARKATKGSLNIIDKVRKLRSIEKERDIGEVYLKDLLNDVLSEYESQFEENRIDIDVDMCDCIVEGGSLLEELFSNLLENSIKHSCCGRIKISSKSTEDECIITVEDDGVGIDDDKKNNIFEKGYKSGENAGTGLGLYMVREIVQSCNGSIEVKDSEIGGAKFDVRLNRYKNK